MASASEGVAKRRVVGRARRPDSGRQLRAPGSGAAKDLGQAEHDLLRTSLDLLRHLAAPFDQSGHDPLDQHLGRGRACGDANAEFALEPIRLEVLGAVNEVARDARLIRRISRRRLEFELVGEPTTSMTSQRRTSCFTASWRFWVA